MADRTHETVIDLVQMQIDMQVELAKLHDHGHESPMTGAPAPGLDDKVQQTTMLDNTMETPSTLFHEDARLQQRPSELSARSLVPPPISQ